MDAMDYIDPALIAAVDGPAHSRGGKRWVRAAMIAACLCLALVGTVAAAQHLGVRIVDGTGGEGDPDVWLEGGIAYYAVDSLSEQVAELDDPGYAAKAFGSWDEMEEFIGVDLMNNPVLDASPAKNFSYGFTAGNLRAQGRFLAIGSGNLTSIYAIGTYNVGGIRIIVRGILFTDRMAECREDWDQRFLGYVYEEGAQVNWENYTTPGGLEAQLMTVERDGSYPDKCRAVFSLNGVPFIVEANVNPDLEASRQALLQVLDGFVLD